ncbi:SufE family protein [Putridiphycobacter roseus]|uniref:SufE family protein n=1 Tax=Putridiphycobacter roseus TaxID=2219161 RepID=A0A2W1N0K3_9FLAO|nr:SufE family protein [Putridiphycobacter roseus]PZE17040.1 SufE family protein [Putridiphycobacter roseus]
MTIEEKEKELIADFSIYEDWMEKYEYIIELGKDLPILKPEHKTKENIIVGCQSQVWLFAEKKGDKVIFTAEADAIIAKGIIALLVDVLSNQTPEAILNTELNFIKEIGLQEHLSPTRSNGLVAMVKQMKLYALALKNS